MRRSVGLGSPLALCSVGAQPVAPSTQQVQEAIEYFKHHPRALPSPFVGMDSVMLHVEVENKNSQFDLVTQERLETKSEVVLRKNSLPLQCFSVSLLTIKVGVTPGKDRQDGLVSISVELFRMVDLRDNPKPGPPLMVPVWQQSGVYYMDCKRQSAIADELEKMLDEFSRDYLRWKDGVTEYAPPLAPTTRP